MKPQPKILYWDIETSMMLAGVFGLYQQDINYGSVVQDWFIFSAQWAWNDGKIESISIVDDPKRFKKDHTDDYIVVKKIHEVLSKADMIVHHNGDKFDLKKFNARAISHGLEPVGETPCFDTLKEARKKFKFTSNRLGDLCEYLEVDHRKGTTSIRNAWVKATLGGKMAIRDIVKYGRKDIPTLRDLYKKLRPFAKTHPNLNVICDTDDKCPRCLSDSFSKAKAKITPTRKIEQMKCNDCGTHSNNNTILHKVKTR